MLGEERRARSASPSRGSSPGLDGRGATWGGAGDLYGQSMSGASVTRDAGRSATTLPSHLRTSLGVEVTLPMTAYGTSYFSSTEMTSLPPPGPEGRTRSILSWDSEIIISVGDMSSSRSLTLFSSTSTP